MARRHRRALSGRSAAAPARLRRLRSKISTCSARIFIAIIDGMEMDVPQDIRAPDMATLDLYCDRVASAVGRLSVKVFGMPREDGVLLAHHLGRALQLTNILRDIDEDAALGRLYLPREGLLLAGITTDDPARGHRRSRVAARLRSAGRAREGAFRQGRRDHGAQSGAARCARRASWRNIIARSWTCCCTRICGAARAGACEQDHSAWYHLPVRFHLMQKTVHIIGAGISGLSAAVRLANAGYLVRVHEATQTGGRPLPFLFRRGDQPHHRQRQPSRAVGQSSCAGLCTLDRHRGRTGRTRRSRNFRLSISRPASAGSSISATPGCRSGCSTKAAAFPTPACAIISGLRRWCGHRPAARSAMPSVARARSISGWCSHCCSRRSMSIRPKVRRGLPAPWCAKRCWRADRPAGR